MPGPDWRDDPDPAVITANLAAVVPGLLAHSEGEKPADLALVTGWHFDMTDGDASVPCQGYRGNLRGDSTVPELVDYMVQVNRVWAVRPELVYGQVDVFFRQLNARLDELHVRQSRLQDGPDSADETLEHLDRAVLDVAGWAHGEWIRIHPFANGNGRTARLLVLWILHRFEIPQLLPITPRPPDPYGPASKLSLAAGDHSEVVRYLNDLYDDLPRD